MNYSIDDRVRVLNTLNFSTLNIQNVAFVCKKYALRFVVIAGKLIGFERDDLND